MKMPKPKEGDYYGTKDVEDLFPKPPPCPPPPPPPPPKKPPRRNSSSSDKGERGTEENPYARLPWILRPFLSHNLKRAEGNPSSVWTVKVTTEKGGEVEQKYQDFHIIVSWYSFLIGALGK